MYLLCASKEVLILRINCVIVIVTKGKNIQLDTIKKSVMKEILHIKADFCPTFKN